MYEFEPNGFVGKRDDDDTPVGLLRRLIEAGHRAFPTSRDTVEVKGPEENEEQWIKKMEAHFGAKIIVRPTDGM